ncbi:hypothetical protein [Microbacterium sp. AG238]|jgi:hypothetical protein|uniref:hypothetical protein n=1 Tax=Microbacterium sp. AG238 TaxID=2183994 RepID=UPI000E75FAB7|nr:hypothetical protein [Microbacterium sp. AG238]RKE59962.1 hypothetical protein DEU36_2392 [Microbacterium sp. AG238]
MDDAMEFDVQPPGDLWRFSVGSPEAHGATWALTCARHTNDVYLSTREHGGGDSKWSFHQSGDWRMQYSQAKAEELGVSRVLSQWNRPAADSLGYTEMIRILLPTSDIVPGAKELTRLSKVEWIDPAPAGMMTVILICVIAPGTQVPLPSDLTPLRLIALHDGSIVMVFRADAEIAGYAPLFQSSRTDIRRLPAPGGGAWRPSRTDPDARGMVDAVSGDGRHEIWDLWL